MIIFRGHLFHTRSTGNGTAVLETDADGALAVDDKGVIVACGGWKDLRAVYPNAADVSFGDRFIFPGFVDAHVHFPQMGMIGSWGEKLLNWLDRYTYPEEEKFADPTYAGKWADRFVEAVLANGTTTAGVYSSNHVTATDLLFSAAESRGLRAAIGKTSMDRHAPASLCRDAQLDAQDQTWLFSKWHRKGRYTSCAINPRFAISCSDSLLRSLGDLKSTWPDLFVQTHFAETTDEIATVRSLFPGSKNYLSVYDQFGLLGPDTLLGHGIHPDRDELQLLTDRQSTIVHCPSSNNFLGSGFCNVPGLMQAGHRVCLGSDIGAGTSFSMLATMREAYYVQKQAGSTIRPEMLLHLATCAGSQSLNRLKADSCFAAGANADFVVLDWRRSNLLRQRLENTVSDHERLFATIVIGDDRIVDSTWVGGKPVWRAHPAS
jgi:guanine deaminase